MQNDDIVRKLQGISEMDVNGYTEENIKIRVVIKMLEILGHKDFLDLEHSYDTDMPDIIITGLERPIIIEVKGANSTLTSHIAQIKRYSYNLDACLSIITNGHRFYFFSPFWDRKKFEERLVLSFYLKELRNEMIAEKVKSLLWRDLGFKQLVENRRRLEGAIVNTEEKIKECKINLTQLSEEEKFLTKKYPKITELKDHIEFLETKVKSDIESFSNIKNQIGDIKEQIRTLKKRIPSLGNELNKTEQKIKGVQSFEPPQTNFFYEGIAVEWINIIALQQGLQIILCKKHEKKNKYIFLIPKTSFKSNFEPSKTGLRLMRTPISIDYCKYVAKIEYLLVPGRNKNFLQELYDQDEFKLWDIDMGPYKYFNSNRNRKMLLWFLRVYEMPFVIKEGSDFIRQPRGNCKIINSVTLKKIQSSFSEGKFSPVLPDDEFKKRTNKIREIAQKYS